MAMTTTTGTGTTGRDTRSSDDNWSTGIAIGGIVLFALILVAIISGGFGRDIGDTNPNATSPVVENTGAGNTVDQTAP